MFSAKRLGAVVGYPHEEVKAVIAAVEEMERLCSAEDAKEQLDALRAFEKGEIIIEHVLDRLSGCQSSERINYFQASKVAECQNVLVVAIGTSDDIDEVLTAATIQISAVCPQTGVVLFVAAKWDFRTWLKYDHDFRKTVVGLKLISSTRLHVH